MAIKLLIVDDSALMRRQLSQLFEAEGDFVVRVARNGQEAVEENLSFEPDVISLDINMPVMDGLEALTRIMNSRPVPVVMVSSLTAKGALATFEAIALGAVDYIAKPGGTISLSIDDIKDELIRKIRGVAKAKVKHRAGVKAKEKVAEPAASSSITRALKPQHRKDADKLVLIGVSTGGPSTLELILPKLQADFPYPVIVVQHMPAAFTGPFAQRMNGLCALEVVEVTRPTEVFPGTVYVGRGGADVVVAARGSRLVVLPKPESPRHLWHPSVEILGRSALEHCDPKSLIGVILTGMGNDGSEAFTDIKRAGGRTIAESEDSAVVFGMPKELIDRGGATLVLHANKIATQLSAWARD